MIKPVWESNKPQYLYTLLECLVVPATSQTLSSTARLGIFS